MKKRELIPYGIAIIALIIGAFYDYSIDVALYHPTSLFGIFFERIILIPIESIIVVTIAMLYKKYHHVLYIVLGFLVSFYVIQDAFQYWMNIYTTLILCVIGVLSILYTFLIFYLVSLFSFRTIDKRLSFFIFFTLVLLSATIITTTIKTFWGRIRFRDLMSVKDFCVWYKPCGLYGNHSFPSGHTTAFTSILCILQWKRNHFEKVSKLRYVCIAMFILLMPYSRMIMGAHFLSDTAMGFIITYSCYLVYRHIFFKGGYL